MKYKILTLVGFTFLISNPKSLAQPFDIQAGIFNTGTTLEVKAIPEVTIGNSILSGINFTIRWLDSYNVNLAASISPFGISKNGPEKIIMIGSDLYRYQIFSGIPNVNITFTEGQQILLLSIPVIQNGYGSGYFELASEDFLQGSGEEWYIEVGGKNRSNSVFNPAITDEVSLPVELTDFAVKSNANVVNLEWHTKSESNSYGFEIERKNLSKHSSANWNKLGFISSAGNSNSPKKYSFSDLNPSGGNNFAYRLKLLDADGKFSYSDTVEITIAPVKFVLYQNYPNPFNPLTNVKVSIPFTSRVKLTIYNSVGEQIKVLTDEYFEPGIYNFEFDGKDIASGTYIYKLETSNQILTKKMLLLK